jgi:hypothetical protein
MYGKPEMSGEGGMGTDYGQAPSLQVLNTGTFS